MELTELIKDYVATELLSSVELDFLEGELWETTQHIAEINTVFKAPKIICEKLDLDEKSCWQPTEDVKGTKLECKKLAVVIWCTGYKSDFSWVDISVFDGTGFPTVSYTHLTLPTIITV